MEKVLVAMSGGVDSSLAAWLTKEKGFDCSGAVMKLFPDGQIKKRSGCGGMPANDAEDARAAALCIGIPFYVFDFTECFDSGVVQKFVKAYKNGLTPNPCVDCNRFIKFGAFLSKALEIGCDRMVTGHYARIETDNGRYLLKKGIDTSKDQSYVLYTMTQEQLSRTMLPLGGLTKAEVRETAREMGFINAKKRDSQDICFVPDGDYAGFIERYTKTPAEKGRFKDSAGNDLGEHKGIEHYTVGQRKGLGISAETPVYVRAVCPENNTVVVGNSGELYSKILTASDINLIAVDGIEKPMRVKAKIRYRQPEQPAAVRQTGPDTLSVEFDEPQRAITKGQAVVLYDGDVVIGGGTIS